MMQQQQQPLQLDCRLCSGFGWHEEEARWRASISFLEKNGLGFVIFFFPSICLGVALMLGQRKCQSSISLCSFWLLILTRFWCHLTPFFFLEKKEQKLKTKIKRKDDADHTGHQANVVGLSLGRTEKAESSFCRKKPAHPQLHYPPQEQSQ